jgi:prepilin-type N-terminal cleavage/methylation domain-containing protein
VRTGRRGGFTLLELVVALVVTGVVALLAYATLQAGLDTSERVERADATLSGHAVARSLLIDALRHLPEGGGAAFEAPLFILEDRTSRSGLPADVLTFVSHGFGRAPGTSGAWLVTLGPVEDGVRLRAAPLDTSEGAPMDVTLAGARGLDAHVLARSAETAWLNDWSALGRVPAAVRIELFDESGRPAASPLVAHAALEAVP